MVEGDDMAFPTKLCFKWTMFLPFACQRPTIDVPLAVDRKQCSFRSLKQLRIDGPSSTR